MVLTCFNLLKYVLSISSPENQHVCKHDHSNIWAFICQYSMFLAHKYPQPPAASQTLLSKRLFPRYPTPRPVASRRGGKCQKISPSELLLQNPFTLSDHIWPLVYLLPVSLDIYIYNYYIIYIYILYTVIYCWYLHHCALSPRPHSQQPSALRCWPHCQPSESPNAPPAAPRGGAPVQDNFEPVPGKNQQASRNGFQCLLRCF